MKTGARVARVSLRSDEGTIGEFGTVRTVYTNDEGAAQGYYIEWDKSEAQPHTRMGYVAPVRVASLEEWQRHQATKEAA